MRDFKCRFLCIIVIPFSSDIRAKLFARIAKENLMFPAKIEFILRRLCQTNPAIDAERKSKMDFARYLRDCYAIKEREPYLRMGQIFYNQLSELKHDLALQIVSTNLDPFYNDNVIPDFLNWVDANWK